MKAIPVQQFIAYGTMAMAVALVLSVPRVGIGRHVGPATMPTLGLSLLILGLSI